MPPHGKRRDGHNAKANIRAIGCHLIYAVQYLLIKDYIFIFSKKCPQSLRYHRSDAAWTLVSLVVSILSLAVLIYRTLMANY